MAEMASVGPDYAAMGWKSSAALPAQRPLRPATIQKIISAIAFLHRAAGHPFDRKQLSMTSAGINRVHGTAERRVTALTDKELRRAVAELPDTLRGLRDRAVLLIGFAAALRRSELVGLDIGGQHGGTGTLEIVEDGIRITLQAKTDQEGAGQVVAIPRDYDFGAIAALEAWLQAAAITDGPVFRPLVKGGTVRAQRLTTHAVAIIIKEAVFAGCVAGGMNARKGQGARRLLLRTLAAGGLCDVRCCLRRHGREHRTSDAAQEYADGAALYARGGIIRAQSAEADGVLMPTPNQTTARAGTSRGASGFSAAGRSIRTRSDVTCLVYKRANDRAVAATCKVRDLSAHEVINASREPNSVTRRMPRASRRSQMAWPMPPAAPVIRATSFMPGSRFRRLAAVAAERSVRRHCWCCAGRRSSRRRGRPSRTGGAASASNA